MQTCREATVLHYAPALDSHQQRIAELTDLVFCILRLHWRGQARLVETETMAPSCPASLQVFHLYFHLAQDLSGFCLRSLADM